MPGAAVTPSHRLEERGVKVFVHGNAQLIKFGGQWYALLKSHERKVADDRKRGLLGTFALDKC